MRDRTISKRLVIYTILAFICMNGIALAFVILRTPDPLNIDVSKGLTFGYPKAPVEVVLFEDVLCSSCQWFMREIYPQIKKEYVDTGIARFTIIPVAFMEGSRELSNAMICVYQRDPRKMFPYLKMALERGDYSAEGLIEVAREMGSLPFGMIQQCIESDRYFPIMKKNYDLGKKLMGDNFGTPTLFIDGVMTPYHAYHLISLRIQKGAYAK